MHTAADNRTPVVDTAVAIMARDVTQERVKHDIPAESSDASVEFEFDDQTEDLVGEVIDGRYEVSELIGSGAMGQVYRAEHMQIVIPVRHFGVVKL